MSLASNALITLDEGREFLGIEPHDDDAVIEAMIDAVSDAVETYTRRNLLSQAYTDEVYNGNGTQWLMLRQYPVTAVSGVEYWIGADNWTALDITYLVIEPMGVRQIYLRDRLFPKSTLNLKVSYTAGYSATTLPKQIKQAAFELLLENWRVKDKKLIGTSQLVIGGQTISLFSSRGQPLPPKTEWQLQPFVRMDS